MSPALGHRPSRQGSRQSPAPLQGRAGGASQRPASPAGAHLVPRAVLESRAEVLRAPSALAGLIAPHGPRGRWRVSEASSLPAAGSHGPGARGAGRRRRSSGQAQRARPAAASSLWRAPPPLPLAPAAAPLSLSGPAGAGSFRVWPRPAQPAALACAPARLTCPPSLALGEAPPLGSGPEGEGASLGGGR